MNSLAISLRRIRLQAGFSLIEVMICIAVIAILMSVMIPSYQTQMQKSKRRIAIAALVTIHARQEQYFILNKQYAARLDLLGYDTPAVAIGAGGEILPISSARKIYELSVQAPLPIDRPRQFILRATPLLSQALDPFCGVLELTSTGIKTASKGSVVDCW